VIDTLVKVTGYDGKIVWDTSKPEGQSRRLFDQSRAEKEIGYKAKTSLAEGLTKTVDWYRANRATARNVVEAPVARAAAH